MAKNPKIPASKAVRRFLSKIGEKGGHAGKGSPRVIEKMRRATEIRLAKQKARRKKQIDRIRPSNPWSMASPDSAGFSFGPAKRWE
jgi:hypothetical protein